MGTTMVLKTSFRLYMSLITDKTVDINSVRRKREQNDQLHQLTKVFKRALRGVNSHRRPCCFILHVVTAFLTRSVSKWFLNGSASKEKRNDLSFRIHVVLFIPKRE